MAQLESKEIGRRIAQARREAGMTQQEIGDLLGVTARSIQGYEAGDVVPYRHFRRLEEVLARSLEWFLRGEDGEDGELADLLSTRHDEVIARFDSLDETLRVLAATASEIRSRLE